MEEKRSAFYFLLYTSTHSALQTEEGAKRQELFWSQSKNWKLRVKWEKIFGSGGSNNK